MSSHLITPDIVLLMAIALTAWACAASQVIHRRRRRKLAEMARQWGMQYSPSDRFNLAARVATRLPIPGAADVRVRDLVYGTESTGHRCIFCAEYTTGVIRQRKRQRCVVSLAESRDSTGRSLLRIAEPDLPLLRQYESLHAQEKDNQEVVKNEDVKT